MKNAKGTTSFTAQSLIDANLIYIILYKFVVLCAGTLIYIILKQI